MEVNPKSKFSGTAEFFSPKFPEPGSPVCSHRNGGGGRVSWAGHHHPYGLLTGLPQYGRNLQYKGLVWLGAKLR